MALIVAMAVAVAYAIELILLVFAGILLAIFLRTIGTWLSAHARVSMRWSMATVLIVFVGVLLGTVSVFGLQIAQEADQFIRAVSQAFTDLQHKLREYRIPDEVVSNAPAITLEEMAKSATSGLVWTAAVVVLILFLGVYLSTNPQLYTEAFLSFFGLD